MPPPKVSVLVVTYNHEQWIDRALRSVYAQTAGFPFDVIISEDHSTDSTRKIVTEWQKRHPDRTRLLLSERNLRSNVVVRRGFQAAQGEYIAMLDGDDFWVSPDKLAKQVAILDADPTLAICFHNARIDGDAPGRNPHGGVWTDPSLKTRLTLADLWDGNPFATCSSLFRRGALQAIPEWYDDFFPITDWPLYVLFAERGDIAYLPDALGAYNRHAGGQFSSRSDAGKLAAMDDMYRRMNELTEYRHDEAIRAAHRRFFVGWVREHIADGNQELALSALDRARGYSNVESLRDRIEMFTLSVRARWPRLGERE
jgi:glycosyltransferase involved in cell wall biosynthesis